MKKLHKLSLFIILVLLLTSILGTANLQAKEDTNENYVEVNGEKFYLGLKPLEDENYNKMKKSDINLYAFGEVKVGLPRSYDLSNQFPKPSSQGQQNSCVGWAVGYAYKSAQEKQDQNWNLNTNDHLFSPAYIYNQINGGQDKGSYIHKAMDLVVQQGCATLATMPYNVKDYKKQPNQTQKNEAKQFKALSWKTINNGDVEAVKSHISRGDGVVIGIPIYEDFMKMNNNNEVWDNTNGNIKGYHAICIVGYDDNKSAFKIINSWGTGWGINGYGWISYDIFKEKKIKGYVMTDQKNKVNNNNNNNNDNNNTNNNNNDNNNNNAKTLQAEAYSQQKGIKTQNCSEGGKNVGWINDGDYLMFKNVNLTGIKQINARVASNEAGGKIEVRLDKPNGKLIGTINVSKTGNWQKWVTKSTNISNTSGQHNLYFVFEGGRGYLFNINWLQLK